MYDVMLIDDDFHVRERLKKLINWEELNLHMVCEAADGETAKDLYAIYRPKIIIADINIPIINGLELTKQFIAEDPDLLVIVITGYSDFEYAKKALRLGVFDLLSKPIHPNTINECLSKAVHSLEEKRQEKLSVAALQRLVDNNLTSIQEMFMANLLRQEPENPSLVVPKMQNLKIPCSGPNYVVAMVYANIPVKVKDDRDATVMLLRKTLEAQLAAIDCELYSFLDPHFRLNCIISAKSTMPDNEIEDAIIKSGETMMFLQGVELFAGIGKTVFEPKDLHLSYASALTTLNYQTVLGSEKVTHYKNLERIEEMSNLQEPIQEYLLQKFRSGDIQAIRRAIQNQVHNLGGHESERKRMTRNFLFEYITNITSESVKLGIEFQDMDDFNSLIAKLFTKADMDSHVDDVMELTLQLSNQLQAIHDVSTSHLIGLAKDYIRDNLGDATLDLERVSDYIGLSKSYFSRLFHKVENVNFSTYLKQERVKQAKKLLRTTNLKVFEIGERCGFSNARYFSYVFKQVTGEKPVEFQNRAK